MKDYKRLGDYIREVNLRNRELKVRKPMGINIDKHFMPSVANIIGTDLSAYKLVCKTQFACNLMHVGRDEKIPMAMWNDANPIIVSPAYFVFEITKTEDLLPEYLMMWFRRTEFDRNAWFYTDADVRGGMNKDALLDMRLPIPTLTRQREIVSEYETLTCRIRLNEQMIEKLEATAQALYHKTFVAGIDKQNLPQGWHLGKLGDHVDLSQGIQVEVEDQSPIKHEGYNRFIRIIDYTPNTKEPPRYVNIANDRYYCTRDDVVVIRYGDAGTICRRLEGIIANNLFKATPKTNSPITRNYLYHFLKSESVQKKIKGSAASSTMPAITHTTIKELVCIIPNDSISQAFDEHVCMIEKEIRLKLDENIKLTELQSLLLARMGK